jgi:hypothetical protein
VLPVIEEKDPSYYTMYIGFEEEPSCYVATRQITTIF